MVETVERVPDESGGLVLAAVRTGVKVYARPSDSRALGKGSDVELETSEAAHSGLQSGASMQAAVTFRNTGERHLRAEGRIEIRRADESVLATLPLPELQTLPRGGDDGARGAAGDAQGHVSTARGGELRWSEPCGGGARGGDPVVRRVMVGTEG